MELGGEGRGLVVDKVENGGSGPWAFNDPSRVLKSAPLTPGLLTCAPSSAFEELTAESSTPGARERGQYFSIGISKQDLLRWCFFSRNRFVLVAGEGSVISNINSVIG